MKKPLFAKTPLAAAASAALVLTGLGAAPAVLAQSSADETQTVVVTARKRAERVLDVPLSISVVGGEEIRDRGAIRLSEVSVPNFTFFGVENNALPSFSVRGVQGQNRSNIGFDSGIGVYVDGVFMGRTAAFNQETFDVERVEFLRGPQGTLFGKNSVAGAISMTTREPGRKFAATGSLDLGSDNQRRFSAYVSSPLGSDSVRASLAFYSGQRDGYMRNLAGPDNGDEDATSVRLKVLFKPSANLDITLAADKLRDRSSSATSKIISGYGFVADTSDYTTNVNVPTSAARNVEGFGGTVNYALGSGLTLTSITSIRKLDTSRTNDTDVGPLDIVATAVTSKQDQWSQELRIATSRGGALEYVAGLYYYKQEVSGNSRSTFGPAAPVLASIRNTTGATFGDIDTTTYAAFINADWNLSPSFTLTGGLRYTKEKKSLAYQQTVTFPAFLAPSLPLEFDNFSTHDASPMLSGRWRLGRDAIVYATYSRGFRSGGWNVDNITAGGPTSFRQTRFGDEQISNYEVGAKVSLAGLGSVGVTAFRMDYDDMQLTQQVQVLGGGGATVGIVTNAGKGKSQGLELDATLRPLPALRLTAALGYTDARYTDYVDTRQGTPLVFTGNRLNFSPRVTASLGASYAISLPVGTLTLRGDYAYVGSYYTGRENLATQLIPQHEIVNARVSLAGASGRWEVAAYVNNLLDDRYIVAQGAGGFAAPVGAGTNRVVDYGRPRTYGIVGTFTF